MNKKRYSLPARIVELLYLDDAYFNEVIKVKKAASGSNFPKSDEWRDDYGFNISFALAGYSPEDVQVIVENNVLMIKGAGMDSISPKKPNLDNDDAFVKYSKESLPRIHTGAISRGIARRKFCVRYIISDEFNVIGTEAVMQHGLLKVKIPNKDRVAPLDIKIRLE